MNLIKMDKTDVLQYREKIENNKRIVIMEDVKNPVVEDKKAMQKWAIVDISDKYKWDIIAGERSSSAYFIEKFLKAEVRETDSVLTEKAANSVLKWAKKKDNEDLLPDGQVYTDYKDRAIIYLSNSDKFDTDNFVDMVVKDPEDDSRKQRMMDSLIDHLEEVGIAGQAFTPNKNSLVKKYRFNKIQTKEGVILTWEGEIDKNRIKIKNNPDGSGIIQIKTDKITWPNND
jgi:hypothetical protein